MDATHVAAEIEDFVRATFKVGLSDPQFGRSVDLFEAGYIDSIGVAETIEFLERRYGARIDEHDLLSDEFATVDGMARIVARKSREEIPPVTGPDRVV